tara:strand:- start:448 stop:1293 length:846 start_codon:yes stop_codon:yes gene_type:complete
MVLEQIDGFFKYINERHQIYCRRQAGIQAPWTEDPIIKEFSFCNVFRELDSVTIWLRKNWKEPYADHPNLPFAMSVARQINWPETLQEIGFPEEWNPDRVKAIMQGRMDKGEKVYTGAYMLTGTLGGTKVEQTIDKILTPLYENQPEIHPDSLQKTWSEYLRYAGFSGFMAYEVVTDLRHTKYLGNARDIYTWANPGPGAKRGLNRIHGRELTWRPTRGHVGYIGWNCEMKDLLSESPKYLEPHVPSLEMRDIEHCLCEFDKYERVRLGQGRPRAKYKYDR